MKALVSGASGFIGANLVRTLLRKGVAVRALVRRNSSLGNLTGLEIELASGDLTDFSSLKKACQGCDLLFHTAAHYDFWASDPQIFYQVNVEGTKNILIAALEAKIPKIVYTSTVGTIRYPDDPNRPSDENCFACEKDLRNDYKRSKFQAEQVAFRFAKEGLPVVIVNPSAPIGAFDIKPTPTGKMILDFLKGRVPAYLETGLNIIDVEDVAEGHWLAAQKGKVGERYILGNANLSLKEIYERLAKLSAQKPPRIRIPYALAFGTACLSEGLAKIKGGRPKIALAAVKMARHYMYFDSGKAIQELGLPQTPVEIAFAKAVEWFKANGYLQVQ